MRHLPQIGNGDSPSSVGTPTGLEVENAHQPGLDNQPVDPSRNDGFANHRRQRHLGAGVGTEENLPVRIG